MTIIQGDGPPSVAGRGHRSPPWDGVTFSDLVSPAATSSTDPGSRCSATTFRLPSPSSTGPTRAVSIEHAMQVRTSTDPVPLAPQDVLACTMLSTHAAEGFALEDGAIWAPGGTLLATIRQTRLAG